MSDPQCDKWVLAVQAVGAIGAIAVAFLAIWGDWVRSKVAQPKLEVSLNCSKGTLTNRTNGGPCRYYHLLVENKRHWAPARSVMVVLDSVERIGPDGEWQQKLLTGPLPMPWQFGGGMPNQALIGTRRLCDLGVIQKESNFKLTLLVTPNSLNPELKKGDRIRIRVHAVSGTSESKHTTLELSWDGEWKDGSAEMAQHLVIKAVD